MFLEKRWQTWGFQQSEDRIENHLLKGFLKNNTFNERTRKNSHRAKWGNYMPVMALDPGGAWEKLVFLGSS